MAGRRCGTASRQRSAAFRRESGQEILFRQYLQWIAHEQWLQARQQSPGLRVSGDFPFGVAADSADVWANQDLFSFDGSVGAPPDAFSEDGQNWQLPVYRWDVMRDARLRVVRRPRPAGVGPVRSRSASITWWACSDRGSSRATAVAPHFEPTDERAQIAQGEAVLRTIISGGAGVIAEDLGTIPDFVRDTLGELGLPGYRVMRWERYWDEPGQPFIHPAEYPRLSVATTGTHDTETLAAWWQGAGEPERQAALGVAATAWRDAAVRRSAPEMHCRRRCAMRCSRRSSPRGSDLLTLPIQDVFGWPDRINVPALIDDTNWTWRLPWPVDALDTQPDAVERQQALRRWSERHARV